MRYVQAEKDGLTRIRDAQHDRVADGLHVNCVRRQFTPDRFAEIRDQGGRFLVPVGLGQRGEAGNVGEQEGGRGVAQGGSYSSTLKLNIMPLSWCSAMWQ